MEADEFGVTPPGPDASKQEWIAYRMAYSERAVQVEQERLKKLHAELVDKIRYADCERALAAFNKVLTGAGVAAEDAAVAQFKLESWDEGFADEEGPNDSDRFAANVWREAVEAGRIELCDNAPFVSPSAFGLVDFLGRDPKQTLDHCFPLYLQTR